MPPAALDAYCERVGWSERARPDLATLTGLLRAYTADRAMVTVMNCDVSPAGAAGAATAIDVSTHSRRRRETTCASQ